MNKILGISNRNYIDTLLSKKMFSFKIDKLSTTDNIYNGKPCDVLNTGYLLTPWPDLTPSQNGPGPT